MAKGNLSAGHGRGKMPLSKKEKRKLAKEKQKRQQDKQLKRQKPN